MNSFVIIFSFILNFISIFAIVILYLRQNRFYNLEKKQENMVKEMEEVFSSFIHEIREDNEKFINKVNEMNKERSDWVNVKTVDNKVHQKDFIKDKLVEKDIIPSEKNGIIDDEVNILLPPIQTPRKTAANAYKHNNNQKLNDREKTESERNQAHTSVVEVKKTIIEEIISLQEQGLSEEEIAKRLNKGKTEIQLLLKFRQKK